MAVVLRAQDGAHGGNSKPRERTAQPGEIRVIDLDVPLESLRWRDPATPQWISPPSSAAGID